MFSAEAVCWRRCQTFSFVFGEFKRKNQDSVCREIGNPVRNRKIGTFSVRKAGKTLEVRPRSAANKVN